LLLNNRTMTMHYDNYSAIYVAQNHVFHKRTKQDVVYRSRAKADIKL